MLFSKTGTVLPDHLSKFKPRFVEQLCFLPLSELVWLAKYRIDVVSVFEIKHRFISPNRNNIVIRQLLISFINLFCDFHFHDSFTNSYTATVRNFSRMAAQVPTAVLITGLLIAAAAAAAVDLIAA